MTKRAPSVASNYDPELFLQFMWDFGEQYANSYRAACNAEHRYQTGKLPAHYPVPALATFTQLTRFGFRILTYKRVGFSIRYYP